MAYIVKSTKEPFVYLISKNEITTDPSKARWFDFKNAHENKRYMNRRTNPRTLWEVASIN